MQRAGLLWGILAGFVGLMTISALAWRQGPPA